MEYGMFDEHDMKELREKVTKACMEANGNDGSSSGRKNMYRRGKKNANILQKELK